MIIDFAQHNTASRYHLMTQTVIPRPIAWALTQNANNTFNLAPFSYFNAVCSRPPLLMIAVDKKPSGENKDTTQNLNIGDPCVIHIPSASHAKEVTSTAATLDYGMSEVDKLGLQLVDQEGFCLPRLAQCKLAYMCQVYDTKAIGDGPQNLIFLEAKQLYAEDEIVSLDEKGRHIIDPLKVDPLARLGASQYSSIAGVMSLVRPK